MVTLLGTFDVQNITSNGTNSTHFCIQCIFIAHSTARGCEITADRGMVIKPNKLRRKWNSSNLRCFLIPSIDSDIEVTVTVWDFDTMKNTSEHEALHRTFLLVSNSSNHQKNNTNNDATPPSSSGSKFELYNYESLHFLFASLEISGLYRWTNCTRHRYCSIRFVDLLSQKGQLLN